MTNKPNNKVEEIPNEAMGQAGDFASNAIVVSKKWVDKALTSSYEQGVKDERGRNQELFDWAEGVVEGTAFSKENGLIWQHWLDEGKRILQALKNN